MQILIFYATFLSFTWAAIFYFKTSNNAAKNGKKIISVIGTPLTLYSMFEIYFLTKDHVGAVILVTLSFVLFWYTIYITKNLDFDFAFSNKIPKSIAVSGPYGFIRHPFYLAYSLCWAATTLATHNLIILIGTLIMFFLYYKSAQLEESTIQNSSHSSMYIEYKRKTGMFLPKIFK